MSNDNGEVKATEATPPAETPRLKRRWFRIGKDTTLSLSVGTLLGLLGGTLTVAGVILFVWYSTKARADTQEVRLQKLEGTDERLERLYEKAVDTVVSAQLTVTAVGAEVQGLKKEREEDRRANTDAHDAILKKLDTYQGEVRMIARSKEPR